MLDCDLIWLKVGHKPGSSEGHGPVRVPEAEVSPGLEWVS